MVILTVESLTRRWLYGPRDDFFGHGLNVVSRLVVRNGHVRVGGYGIAAVQLYWVGKISKMTFGGLWLWPKLPKLSFQVWHQCDHTSESDSLQPYRIFIWSSEFFAWRNRYMIFVKYIFRKLVQFSCWCHCGHRCWTLRFRNNYNDSFILARSIRLFIWNDCLKTDLF